MHVQAEWSAARIVSFETSRLGHQPRQAVCRFVVGIDVPTEGRERPVIRKRLKGVQPEVAVFISRDALVIAV